MKKVIFVTAVFLLLALPASALGRSGIFLKGKDYDSGQVVVEGYPPNMSYNMYEKSGLIPGDRILSIAGRKVTSPRSFNEIMDSLKPNEKVKVRIARGGKKMDLDLDPAVDDFGCLNSLGKLLTKGEKVKIAVVVVSVYDQRGDGVDTARKFWAELPYNVMMERMSRNDYGKYTAFLTLVDPALSWEITRSFSDRKAGDLTADERNMIKTRTGATYVLTISYISTVPEPGKVLNKVDMTIVALSGGEVVGKTHLETLYDASNGKELKNTVDGYEKKSN